MGNFKRHSLESTERSTQPLNQLTSGTDTHSGLKRPPSKRLAVNINCGSRQHWDLPRRRTLFSCQPQISHWISAVCQVHTFHHNAVLCVIPEASARHTDAIPGDTNIKCGLCVAKLNSSNTFGESTSPVGPYCWQAKCWQGTWSLRRAPSQQKSRKTSRAHVTINDRIWLQKIGAVMAKSSSHRRQNIWNQIYPFLFIMVRSFVPIFKSIHLSIRWDVLRVKVVLKSSNLCKCLESFRSHLTHTRVHTCSIKYGTGLNHGSGQG